MGEDYWIQFEREAQLVEFDRNRRDRMYGGADPGAGGWRAGRMREWAEVRAEAARRRTAAQEAVQNSSD